MTEPEHPAVRLYGAVDYETAAKYWYSVAIDTAKDANVIYNEKQALDNLPLRRILWRRITRFKPCSNVT